MGTSQKDTIKQIRSWLNPEEDKPPKLVNLLNMLNLTKQNIQPATPPTEQGLPMQETPPTETPLAKQYPFIPRRKA